MERDWDLMNEYIKKSQIFIICHSLEQDINEIRMNYLSNYVISNSGTNNIYIVGCKYDIKVMNDFQMGNKITALKFQNENLASYGQKIKKFINTPPVKKGYFLCSSLLNFNIREMINEMILDFVAEMVENSERDKGNNNQNCKIY
jgi:hypothetical protein